MAGLASGKAKLVRKLLPATEVRIEFMNHGEPGVRLRKLLLTSQEIPVEVVSKALDRDCSAFQAYGGI